MAGSSVLYLVVLWAVVITIDLLCLRGIFRKG